MRYKLKKIMPQFDFFMFFDLIFFFFILFHLFYLYFVLIVVITIYTLFIINKWLNVFFIIKNKDLIVGLNFLNNNNKLILNKKNYKC